MAEKEYHLEKYTSKASRHKCPSCGAEKEFTRYVDNFGNYLSENVGKCNREVNCGYHYPPKRFFEDSKSFAPTTLFVQPAIAKTVSPSFIPQNVFDKSIANESQDFLTQYLSSWGADAHNIVRNTYLVRESKRWDGATVFWQKDIDGKIRDGKIMLYDKYTCKRVKGEQDYVSWVHTVLKLSEYRLSQCFFGEHLLSGNDKTVCIVESEKTAIICHIFFPQYVWIATGGKNGAKWTDPNVNEVLRGRNVILHPDYDATDDWTKKCELLKQNGINAQVSSYLTQMMYLHGVTYEKADLADVLLMLEPGQVEYDEAIMHVNPEIIHDPLRIRDSILVADIRDELIERCKSGSIMGKTTYYPELDKLWTWMKGELTLLAGIGNHGKSMFLKHLCLLRAMRDGEKFVFFSPEENPPVNFYSDLIRIYLGKPTFQKSRGHATEAEIHSALDFLEKHFVFIYPENDSPTPEYINDRFAEAIEKFGVDGCIIDPYNQLDNDIAKNGGREDQYLSKFLSNEKRFAIKHNVYKIIVSHPKVMGKLNKDGTYPVPDVFDLSGGAMWSNKCDNIMIWYRNPTNSETAIASSSLTTRKIKRHYEVGSIGTMDFIYNTDNFRLYAGGYCPFDMQNTMQGNINFSEPIDEEHLPF